MKVWKTSPPVPVLERPVRPARSTSATPASLARLKSALDAIPNSGARELTYDQWRDIVFGIHHATDGSDDGLALAHEFSERSTKYDAAFLDSRVWPYVRSDRDGPVVTENTVYTVAYGNEWLDPTLADGFTCGEAGAAVATPGASQAKPKFPIYRLSEFAAQPPLKWLIKDVLPREDIGLVYGASGSGKSFFVLDLAACVAMGVEWRGKRVTQGRVLYIAAEGSGGVRKRLIALAADRAVPHDGLHIDTMPATPNFTDRAQVQAVIHAAVASGPYALIVIDTLAQVSAGADENSAKDMGVVMGHARALGRLTGAMVLVVHHSGKDASKGARGSTTIKGGLDVEIEVVRADRDRTATVSKLRDEEDAAEFGFQLRQVVVGEDEEGEPVTSCVVAYTDSVAKDRARQAPVGRNKVLAYEAIREWLGGDTLPNLEQVTQHCLPSMNGGDTKSNRGNLRRALNALMDEGKVVLEDGGYRLPRAGE